MAAPVMRDAAIPALRQEEHLVFESISAQRPAVTENYRLTLTPIVVIDLSSIFGRYRTHWSFPFRITRGRSPVMRFWPARMLAALRPARELSMNHKWVMLRLTFLNHPAA